MPAEALLTRWLKLQPQITGRGACLPSSPVYGMPHTPGFRVDLGQAGRMQLLFFTPPGGPYRLVSPLGLGNELKSTCLTFSSPEGL